ncbi:NAD(P)H-binding protein [Solirubrobacter taibaiensis]|nr:NAD(P)H-binding protein [Solirubrobacter taibaiensis]
MLTGATGFVGGRLLEELRGRGPLRCVVRDASRIESGPDVEVVEADLTDTEAIANAMDGVDCAYYLVHSMEAGGSNDFASRDRELAANMAEAARRADLRRIVYLGGVEGADGRSEHLESRHEVERILSAFGGEFVALRASMIIGAGSGSFDALAQLVERLPVLALPTWRKRLCQPVAIDNVIAALVACDDVAPGSYDIAGPDRLTFEELTVRLGELQGNPRPTVALPFSNSKLEGAVAALFTDQDTELLTPLMAGLDADLVVEDNALERVFGITPTPFDAAVTRALAAH